MFVPNSFTDGSAGGTPITAATLNNLENGLVAADITNPASAAGVALALGYAPSRLSRKAAAGRRGMFLGDSITVGSGAVYGRQWVYLIFDTLGTTRIAPLSAVGVVAAAIPGSSYLSVNAGVNGNTTADMLARLDAALTANTPDFVTLLALTNDVAQGIALATSQANVIEIARRVALRGIPLIVGTVPPMGSPYVTATMRKQIFALNLWLQNWAPRNGIELAQVNQALTDPTTGDMLAAYNSGDGIHPNNIGHTLVAAAFVAALTKVLPAAQGWVSSKGAGLINNPLMSGGSGTTLPTEWNTMFGGTGTAPNLSVQAKDGNLVAGQWLEMEVIATSASSSQGVTANYTPGSTGLTPGGIALLVAQVEIVDVAGNYLAAEALDTGGAAWSVQAQDGSNTNIYATTGGRAGTLTPGPICIPFVVPAGVTTGYLWFRAFLPSGSRAKFRIGCADIIDLTILGNPNLNA